MKHLTITIILFAIALAASSQVSTKFQMNAIYGKGNVVYYPTPDVFWITKSAFTAKAAPVEGALWTRFYYPGPTTNTTSTVNKSSFDSLLNSFNNLSSIFNTLTDRLKSVETKQQQPAAQNLNSVIKISQFGAALLKVSSDSLLNVRSLIEGPDIGFLLTDSTIQPILKKH